MPAPSKRELFGRVISRLSDKSHIARPRFVQNLLFAQLLLYKSLREGARRVIGATAKPLYPIDGKAEGLDRRSPQRPPSSREGDRPQAVEGVFSRRKAYSFPKLKYMRQNAEPCACLRRILLILYLIRRGQSMSLPFSGGNIRPERKKFNKSNSPLSPPLTALKFLNIPALFFRNSLDFAACHRLQ